MLARHLQYKTKLAENYLAIVVQ